MKSNFDLCQVTSIYIRVHVGILDQSLCTTSFVGKNAQLHKSFEQRFSLKSTIFISDFNHSQVTFAVHVHHRQVRFRM